MGGTVYFYGKFKNRDSFDSSNFENTPKETYLNPNTILPLKDLYVKNMVFGSDYLFCISSKKKEKSNSF